MLSTPLLDFFIVRYLGKIKTFSQTVGPALLKLKLAGGGSEMHVITPLWGTLFFSNEPVSLVPTVGSDRLHTGLFFWGSALEALLALPLTTAGSVAPSTGC